MHCSIALAAILVAAALATPVDFKLKHKHKRALIVETVYDVVYEYVYVTATDSGPAAAPTTAVSTTTTPTTTTTSSTTSTTTSTSSSSSSSSTTATHSKHSTSKKNPPPSSPSTTVEPVQATPTPAPTSAAEVTTTVVQAAGSAAAAAPSSAATSYQDIILLHHNVHRGNHSAPDITWSDELASVANTLASGCVYEHNTKIPFSLGGYGQNIGAGSSPSQVSDMITNLMYNAEMPYYASYYGDVNPSFAKFESWGHFTQIVWKSTTMVGCATVQCGSISGVGSDIAPYMTVCNYYPAGNMGGEYGDNVGSPRGEATISGDYGL